MYAEGTVLEHTHTHLVLPTNTAYSLADSGGVSLCKALIKQGSTQQMWLSSRLIKVFCSE